MTDSTTSSLVPTEVAARVPGLGFRFLRPTDWVLVDLPAEKLDISNPYAFLPLGVSVARYGAVVFMAAARPAFDDGTLSQWLEHFARANHQDPGPVEREALRGRDAAACWGMQVNDGLVMRARLVFLEDGGHLIALSVMAPNELWASLAATLFSVLHSFELTTPAGANVPLCPPGVTLPESTFANVKVEVRYPDAAKAESTPPAPAEPAATAAPAPTSSSIYAANACADDAASLDPEASINANLRARGVGFVPRVLETDAQQRCATLAAAALRASLKVPFGWHVIDDSRRTLVFDAEGKIQVNLQRVATNGQSHDQMLAATTKELRREQPGIEAIRLMLGTVPCLGVRNLRVDGELVDQAYLLAPAPDDDVLRVRVTASRETITRALDLTEALLHDVQWFAAQPN